MFDLLYNYVHYFTADTVILLTIDIIVFAIGALSFSRNRYLRHCDKALSITFLFCHHASSM